MPRNVINADTSKDFLPQQQCRRGSSMLAPVGTALLKPCLVEILRTCVHPPSIVLRVEYVFGKAQVGSPGNPGDPRQELEQEQERGQRRSGDHGDSDNESRHASEDDSPIKHEPSSTGTSFRLVLSDGQYQMQAVLAPDLHSRQELLQLQVGSVVDVQDFEVRSAPRLNRKGRVVYLGVQSCEVVTNLSGDSPANGVPRVELEKDSLLLDAVDEMSPQKRTRNEQQSLKDDFRGWSRKRERKPKSQGSSSATSAHQKANTTQGDDSDDDDGFDTVTVSQSQIEQRRETLRRINETPAAEQKATSRPSQVYDASQLDTQQSLMVPYSPATRQLRDNEAARPKQNLDETDVPPIPAAPSAQALPPPQIIPPTPKITPLSTLLSVAPQKSYPCPPLLAVISWTSPSLIHGQSYTPFPPKRHVKIHDSSISSRYSGLTVAVFVDAANFQPPAGRVALFRGLVMNSVRGGEDVILNRYPVRRPAVGAGQDQDEGRAGGQQELEEWFVSDEEVLVQMGYNVPGMKAWWEERSKIKKEEKTKK